MKSVEQRLDEVFGLYRQFGDADYIGEPVSQLEHMSQAARLALAEGFDDEVVLAAFFHDIGHICPPGAQPAGDMGAMAWPVMSASGPTTCAGAVSASGWRGWWSITFRPSVF
ncbi:hypothetical protein [Pseudomonas sp. FEN]|nr:hypothetical protein [Pseudomonas sp. FEN]